MNKNVEDNEQKKINQKSCKFFYRQSKVQRIETDKIFPPKLNLR